MLRNNIEVDLKTKLIEAGVTQTKVADDLGLSLSYVNRMVKGKEQVVSKTLLKMLEELGYDVELVYVERTEAADE